MARALEAFAQGKYEEFDGLVGDTACQIRAAKVYDLAYTGIRSPADTAFLVNAYFLNGVKKITPQEHTYLETIDDKEGSEKFGITKTQTTLIRKHAQKALSQASVEYVQAQAKSAMLPFVSGDYRLEDTFGRSLIPCYFTMRILLKKRPYILLKCKESILYDRDRNPISVDKVEKDMPVMVIEGFCLEPGKRKITDVPLKTIILANAAQHAQYTGENKLPPILDEKEQRKFDFFKELAQQLGCSLSNPSLFCIDHIFCSRLGAQI